MLLWLSGVSAASADTQRHVLGEAREFRPVNEDGARVQGDIQVVHGRSLLSAKGRV